MARPEKTGHRYYPFYTSRDDTPELQMMSSFGGAEGFRVVVQFDRIIAGNLGYYADNNPATLSNLHEYCPGTDLKVIKEMLELAAVKIGYYDKEMLQKHNIFTNKFLQENHLFNSQRRKNFYMKKEYFLLSNEEVNKIGLKKKIKKSGKFIVFQQVNDGDNYNEDNNYYLNEEVNVNNNYLDSVINDSNNKEIKLNKIKENKIKENKRKEKENNCLSNSYSSSEEVNVNKEKKLLIIHNVVLALIKNNILNEKDEMLEIQDMSNFCFEILKSQSYTNNQIINAGVSVKDSMLKNLDTIADKRSYFKKSMMDALESLTFKKEAVKEDVPINNVIANDEIVNEAEELEKLKAKRKNKCN